MVKHILTRMLAIATVAATFLAFQNCNNMTAQKFDTPSNVAFGPNGLPMGWGETPPPPPTGAQLQVGDTSLGTTFQTTQQYQAVMAVRGSSCLVCHGRINNSIITDFGYPDPYYYDSAFQANRDPLFAMPYYNHLAGYGPAKTHGAYSLANIKGSVIVPIAPVPATLVAPFNQTQDLFGQASLGRYLQLAINQPSPADPFFGPVNGLEKTDFATVVEKGQVNIRVPTAAEIRADSVNGMAPLTYIPSQGARSTTVPGLIAAGGYFTNNGVIQCEGDIVFEDLLFLNNAQIQTNNGCRIYSTRPIFVQGSLTAAGSSEFRNIQLISSSAILFGFNSATLATRFQYDYPTRQNSTKAAVDAYKASLLADAAKIPGLVDAGATVEVGTTQNYARLLLMAPLVESRYTGMFSGFLIAEIAMFRLGHLQFSLDPVFTMVSPFPLLKKRDYVSVK